MIYKHQTISTSLVILLSHLFIVIGTEEISAASKTITNYDVTDKHSIQENISSRPMPSMYKSDLARKCEPMFSLSDYIKRARGKVADGINERQVNPNKIFSFPVPNIKMAFAPENSTIHSALKLISMFNPIEAIEGIDQEETERMGEDDDFLLFNSIRFDDNQLSISGVNLTMLDVHLRESSDAKFGIGLNVRNCTISGRFSYKGSLPLSDSPLTGFYRMSIHNVYLIAASNLTKVFPKNPNEDPELKTNGLSLNITHLGLIDISISDKPKSREPSANYLLRLLERLLQRTIKRTYNAFESYITSTLERECHTSINCELSRYSPILDRTTTSIGHEDFTRIFSLELARSNLGQVPLADTQIKQPVFGTQTTIILTNGTLNGLKNIYLNGDFRVKLENGHLFTSATIGWHNLTTHHNWNLTVGNSQSSLSKGSVSFVLRRMEFEGIITKGLEGHRGFNVEQLKIDKFESPQVDITGLPGMNRITRSVVNYFMNRLKQRITDTIQPILKQRLEAHLNKYFI